MGISQARPARGFRNAATKPLRPRHILLKVWSVWEKATQEDGPQNQAGRHHWFTGKDARSSGDSELQNRNNATTATDLLDA